MSASRQTTWDFKTLLYLKHQKYSKTFQAAQSQIKYTHNIVQTNFIYSKLFIL